MSGAALLDAEGLVAGFGDNTVLHGVSFQVREGEIAGMFGLNGAGKSVTMKVVAGLVPARAGRVLFNGEDVTRLTPEQRVERGVANVPQGRQVFATMTVEENLRVGAVALRRRDKSRYDRRPRSRVRKIPCARQSSPPNRGHHVRRRAGQPRRRAGADVRAQAAAH